jgi:ABC-type multidrug transport system permease subunit
MTEKMMKITFAGTVFFLVMSVVCIIPAVPTFVFVLSCVLLMTFGMSFCVSTVMVAKSDARQSREEKIAQPLTSPETDLHCETCQQEKE